MNDNRKIPPGSIELVPFVEDEWEFQFPRLDGRIHDAFSEALDELDAGRLDKAERGIQVLLDDYPEFIDAYHHLAIIFDRTGRHKEARQFWETAVRIGLDAFPQNFDRNRHKLPWRCLDNRPFLRAYHAWGLQMLAESKVEEALAIFNASLSFNPDDNQGIRALAIDCYFRLGQPENVLKICEIYPDDIMEVVLYGWPLALIQLNCEPEARTALQEAVKILPNVAKELLKKTHRKPKNLHSKYITHGGADQAYYYWQDYGQYWKNTKGALELLLSVFQK